MNHRDYVGGEFDHIGKWQFDYLLENTNISPSTIFLDIACGCFRLGKHLIPYLNSGCYFGIDGNKNVVQAGLEHELKDVQDKRFRVEVNKTFDFSFCGTFDIAWSNSLLSHLTIDDIALLFTNLKTITNSNSVFYFTYFDRSLSTANNPNESHPNRDFFYRWKEIQDVLTDTGWTCSKTEVQSHPRKQTIVCAKIA